MEHWFLNYWKIFLFIFHHSLNTGEELFSYANHGSREQYEKINEMYDFFQVAVSHFAPNAQIHIAVRNKTTIEGSRESNVVNQPGW